MKKVQILLSLFVITAYAHAQEDNKIVIGKVDSIYSRILNEQRKVWVYVPDMTSGMHDRSQRYPVVYLLDGDAHFPSVAGMIQQLSQVNGNTVFPEMILVGIPNTDRTRDLTPTHVDADPPMMDSNFSRTSGGGENFVAFIEKELIPHIDSVYPTTPYRTLIGHSFGGLTVINVLANHTKLFNAYVAIDPSMWYDKGRFLKATEQKLKAPQYAGVKLYMGIANTMPDGMTLEKMKKDTTSDTRHIRSIFELDRFLKANPLNGLKYAGKYYSDDNHGSVPLVSEYNGLRFIFDYYQLKLSPKDYYDNSNVLAAKYQKHYENISKQLGYKVMPPELLINMYGYDAMANKLYAKAASLFEMNIENYPGSSNVYDSYGDFFAAKKDTANAVAYYRKALAVDNVPETKRKLDILTNTAAFKLSADELKQYAGEFSFEGLSLVAKLAIENGSLIASVPGEGDFELVPVARDIFSVKRIGGDIMNGYNVQFERSGEKISGFTSHQPDGTYKAHLQ